MIVFVAIHITILRVTLLELSCGTLSWSCIVSKVFLYGIRNLQSRPRFLKNDMGVLSLTKKSCK